MAMTLEPQGRSAMNIDERNEGLIELGRVGADTRGADFRDEDTELGKQPFMGLIED